MIFTAFRHLARQAQIVGVELCKVRRKRHIAGADLPRFVLYDGVHRKAVILPKLAPHGKKIKLPDTTCRPADTPAKKHIEFQPALTADSDQRRDIQRLEKRHHVVRRVHPQLIRTGAGGRFWVDNSRLHSSPSNVLSSTHLAKISFTSPPAPRIFYLTEYSVSETDRP